MLELRKFNWRKYLRNLDINFLFLNSPYFCLINPSCCAMYGCGWKTIKYEYLNISQVFFSHRVSLYILWGPHENIWLNVCSLYAQKLDSFPPQAGEKNILFWKSLLFCQSLRAEIILRLYKKPQTSRLDRQRLHAFRWLYVLSAYARYVYYVLGTTMCLYRKCVVWLS